MENENNMYNTNEPDQNSYDQNPYSQNVYGEQPVYEEPQAANEQPVYEEPQAANEQPAYSEPPVYENVQDPYPNLQSMQTAPKPQINHIFAIIFLTLTPVSYLFAFVELKMMFSYLTYDMVLEGNYFTMMNFPGSSFFNVIGLAMTIASIVFLVLDAVQVHRAGYKVVGLVLFGVFLKPVYYIWRAIVLKQPKLWPAIYTAVTSLLVFGYFAYCFSWAFQMVATSMRAMGY